MARQLNVARRLITMRRLITPRARLLVAPPGRAWIEALALGLALVALVWVARTGITTGERQNGVFIALLSAMSWYSIRLRRSSGAWQRRIGLEIAAGIVPAVTAGCVVLGVGLWAMPECQQGVDESGLLAVSMVVLVVFDTVVIKGEKIPPPTIDLTEESLPVISTMLISGIIAFFIARGVIHVWQYWARLRRRHLIWALTHSHMMLVVLGLFVFAMIMTVNTLSYLISRERESNLVFSVALSLIVPMLIIIGFMTMVLVGVVLLPSLALSYVAARRTTRRLRSLTEATAALRQGDYSVRVPVQGEDEVAALQTDFNVMAHDLERAIQDVQTERDTVAKLLRNRRELVASVSHELRTPVATLRSYLETIPARWGGQVPDDLLQDIGVMENETLRLQRLLDDLFSLSRAEVGELAITRQPTGLPAVIRRIAAAVAPGLWQTYKVELVLDLPADLPLASVDAMRLEQILHNLLRNAVRHTPPGGIVAIAASATDTQVIVHVKDTGEGIAAEHLPYIWDRFYRVPSSSHDQAGAGLGLALVKELAEAMGGSVGVASTPGFGSTFSIFLPRA